MTRGYFGMGIYNPKTTDNMGTLWRSAFLFGASYIFTIGARYHKQPTDTPDTMKHVPLYNYKDWADFIEHQPKDCEVVCIELDEKSHSLVNYVHSERAVYVLGAEDYGIPAEYLKGNQVVQIPTEEKWSMNVSVSGSIVLYDRKAKGKLAPTPELTDHDLELIKEGHQRSDRDTRRGE